jgi:hypothetical protein
MSILRWNAIAKECREYAATHPLPNGRLLRLDNVFDLQVNNNDNGGEVV